MKDPYSKYKKTQLGTASKENVLLMLYEGAIRFCKLSKKAFENNDLAQKGLMIGKTMDIVFELKNTLDHKVSPEVASQLDSLYNYMIEELTKANMNNDTKKLDDVINVLETLYSGWIQAVEQFQKEKSTEVKK